MGKKNKMVLNPTKIRSLYFFTNSLKDRNKRMGIRIGGKVTDIKKAINFLRITLESNMEFTKPKKIAKRKKKRMKIIGAIAKKEWGWNRKKLITIYKTMMESNVWKASAWLEWISENKMEELERAQREAIRKISGLVKSTPKEYIYEENIELLSVTAKRKAVTMYEKVMRMPETNPLRKTATKRMGPRLKKKRLERTINQYQ